MTRIRTHALWIATALLLSALTCNLPFLPGQRPQRSSVDGQGIGTLEPGGQLTGVDDVLLATTEGALEEPVQVLISRSSDPTDVTPLPESMDQHGGFYHLGAESDTFAPVEHPFVVGLPLPDGAPTEDLALAVLVPAQYIHIDTRPGVSYIEPADAWDFLPATHDEESNQALAVTPSLTASPVTATLVSATYFSSTSSNSDTTTIADQQSLPSDVLLGTVLNRHFWFSPYPRQADEPDFIAVCGPPEGDADAGCEQGDLNRAALDLERVYSDLTGLGFRLPRLNRRAIHISLRGRGASVDLGAYVIEVRPCDRSELDTVGLYISNGRAWACNGNGMDMTIRHEYFHATQYAYEAVLENATTREGWFIEGQATASQQSESILTRDSARGLRDVDKSLRGNNGVYRAQDFWLYVGKKLNADLTFLIPIFDYPPNAEGVNAAILEEYPRLQNLPSLYWDWVKNQTFEKVIDLDILGVPCTLSITGDGRYRTLTISGGNPTGEPRKIVYDLSLLVYEEPSEPLDPLSLDDEQLAFRDRGIRLRALDADVVIVEFPARIGGYSTPMSVLSSNVNVRSKFYDVAYSGGTRCRDEPDASSLQVGLQSRQSRTIYVLIANTDMVKGATACISFREDPENCNFPSAPFGTSGSGQADEPETDNGPGDGPGSGPEGVPPAGAGVASCLLGSWTLDNDSYLALLQSLDMPDVTFTGVGGSYTLSFQPDGVVHTADHTVLGVTTPQGSIDVTVNEEGSTEYWTEDAQLHMAGGQLLSASIGGGLDVEDARPGGSAPYGCQGDLLALYVQEASSPLVWHREGQ